MGLAGDRGLGLAFDLCARKEGAEKDALLKGVGDLEFRNKRECVKERRIVEKLLNPKAASGDSSIKPL